MKLVEEQCVEDLADLLYNLLPGGTDVCFKSISFDLLGGEHVMGFAMRVRMAEFGAGP